MKNIKFLSVVLFLSIVSFSGFCRTDSSAYYASSRLDYYTGEKVGEILVYVPERLKEHRISIDIVFEYEFLNKGFSVASSGVSTVPFPMKRLKTGQNELTVSFYEDNKWVDSRKVWITIRPHHDNTVKVDLATGGLFVDGLPFCPFGFYTYFPVQPTLPEDEAVKGFNLISPYQKADKNSIKDRKAYMDRCASLGMKVNYNLCSVAGGGGVGSSRLKGFSKQEKLKMLRKEIETFRHHPALLAWYIADEPDGQNIPPDSLKETFNLIKELDPYHPVSIVFLSPGKAADYREVMDIAMTDPYPVPQGEMTEVATHIDLLKNAFWLEKPVWAAPQASGGNEGWQREPDPGEVRAMTYLAIIHGATGIQYFIRSGPNICPKSTTMWDECAAMALEVAELTPELNSPHPAPAMISDDPHIHAKAWNRAGLVTVAVVNDRNEPCKFRLNMVNLDLTIVADVMFENRKIQVTGGAIEDFIDGYGTRVYRFDARNKPDWMKDRVQGNLTVDPGFEDISNVGVPAACYANAAYDHGNTYFIDSRRFQQGEHSLRLNNPSAKPGTRLSFYSTEPEENKSYTISIMARTGLSSNLPGGEKDGPVKFRLALGSEERVFNCTDSWQKYEINAIRATGQANGSDEHTLWLEMAGKGTAWFDLLQVYPDMEAKIIPGEKDRGSLIELVSIHPDVKIYYTTDGSEPSPGSLPYMIPVEIDHPIILKAAAYKDGMRVGYIEEKVTP